MIKSNTNFRIGLSAFLISIFLTQTPCVWADHHGGGHDSHYRSRSHFYVRYPYPYYGGWVVGLPSGFVSLTFGGLSYYYNDGIYYRRYADRYVVVPAPIGVEVVELPAGCEVVSINGATYYRNGGVYYRPSRYGYVVVSEPRVVVSQPVVVSASPVAGSSHEKFGMADVIVLSKSGVSDDVIIDKIIRTGSTFNLSVEEVNALTKEGVSSRVVNFMLGIQK